jgi:starch phosphorylase
VELYADGLNGEGPVRQEMTCGRQMPDTRGYLYRASAPAARPASGLTVRVIPHHSGASVPLENALILWQR